MDDIFPHEVLRLGPIALTDTAVSSAVLSLFLASASMVCMRFGAAREVLEVIYEFLEGAIERMVSVDARRLVPLVLTQWLFILSANLVGLLPGLGGQRGLAQAEPVNACVEADVLGGSWDDPVV